MVDKTGQGGSDKAQDANQGIEQDGQSHRPGYALRCLKGAMEEVEEVG